jgi:CheY-like chemotaxis protein
MDTVNDIVEISQISAGQLHVSNSEVNIISITDELFSSFNTMLKSKGLELIIENKLTDKNDTLTTDRNKLKAILSNLISNAIKFTEFGVVKIGICIRSRQLEFYVQDTGIGIPENKQSAIFERFVQADISNTRQFEGFGLGLSIAKEYVEMLGGKIWVESEVGKGSVFYFTLPLGDEFKEKSVVKNVFIPNSVKTQIGLLKILTVEDDEASAKLLKIAVKTYGREFYEVKNGVAAVEMCRNNPDIDLVLMDIKMPGMDGYEATRQIRQFNTTIIIIAQTAFTQSGDKEKILQAGFNDYISKPIKKETLMVVLQKYFTV